MMASIQNIRLSKSKGTFSLDLLVTTIIILMMASTVISFVYFEEERILLASYELGAQVMAIGIGSAINQFTAIDPSGGNITLQLKDISRDPSDIGMTGVPFSNIIVSNVVCNYTISNGNVTVEITPTFAGTGRTRSVSASYPIFAGSLYKTGNCTDTIFVNYSKVST